MARTDLLYRVEGLPDLRWRTAEDTVVQVEVGVKVFASRWKKPLGFGLGECSAECEAKEEGTEGVPLLHSCLAHDRLASEQELALAPVRPLDESGELGKLPPARQDEPVAFDQVERVSEIEK